MESLYGSENLYFVHIVRLANIFMFFHVIKP